MRRWWSVVIGILLLALLPWHAAADGRPHEGGSTTDEAPTGEELLAESREPDDLGRAGPLVEPVPEDADAMDYEMAQQRQRAKPTPLNLAESRYMYPCGGYGTLPRYNSVEDVAVDRYAFDIFPSVTVGNGNGNINWALNPYQDLGWKLWFSSLRWLGTTIEAARAGDEAAFRKAETIILDWKADHGISWLGNSDHMEANTHRLNVLICFREVVLQRNNDAMPAEYEWLDDLLELHAEHNIARWSGATNHGSMENQALLGYGCLMQDATYQSTAMARLHRAFPMQVDAEGLSNEASPPYANFNYQLFTQMLDIMHRCGHRSPQVEERLALMATSLAHMVSSTGNYWEYGTTTTVRATATNTPELAYAATNGVSGVAPKDRIRAYSAGFVFGRSGWGSAGQGFSLQNSWFLRGGTGREHKAHRGDVMELLYTARGRNIVVDGAFAGVTDSKWHAWNISDFAHNTIHVTNYPQFPGGKAVVTRTNWSRDGRADFTEISQPYGVNGSSRTRGVMVLSDPEAVVVLDQTRINDGKPHLIQTLWNLPPGQTTTTSGRSVVNSTVDGGSTTKTVMFFVPFWGNPNAQRGELFRYRGVDGPIPRGFYFPRTFRPQPIDQVGFSRHGNSVATISVIVPTRKSARVGISRSHYQDGATRLIIRVGSDEIEVRITKGGYMSRVG